MFVKHGLDIVGFLSLVLNDFIINTQILYGAGFLFFQRFSKACLHAYIIPCIVNPLNK